ncbi:T9SS type A sorting domain-containing protein [Dysgonomonas gadei]|uniref:T9SS type A sorting domain-containing protein n=1 Tax=Dysgonomonas gadei TaxID=156974 RepID=UPI003AF0CDB4
MKAILLMLISAFMGVVSVSGQLNALHNYYRPGDVLIKQQVEFIGSGQPGVNKVWDFSKLKTVNDEYTLTYSRPPVEGDSVYILGDVRYNKKKIDRERLIVGTEHNTMYYYYLSGDSLLQTGHENPSVKLAYNSPIVLMLYPLNYGQSISSQYRSEGLYSGTVAIHTKGTVTTAADAYGKILLPSGDTLGPVLRVKTEQTILDVSDEFSVNTDGNDKGKLLETCRWYSKGYRYPVFETVRNINLSDSAQIFATAFYYPPQDHLYLDTDSENKTLLDELWKDTEKDQTIDPTAKTVTLEDIMTCKIYPNPVVSTMNIEYELKQDAKVVFELYSIEGLLVKKMKSQSKSAGIYYETMDCTGLHPKNYVLRITANGAFVNEVVIKK